MVLYCSYMTASTEMHVDLSGLDIESASDSVPKHEQLRDYLLAELKTGRLSPGQALPTEMDLSHRLRISRSTIRHAFGDLERDGLIRRIRGKGTFVCKQDSAKQSNGLRIFALVMPELRSGYYPSIVRAFEDEAADLNYQVMTCNSGNDIRKQGDIVLQLIDKNVAGVAIVPATTPVTPMHQIVQLQKHDIPVVFCHRRVPGISAPLLALPFQEVGKNLGNLVVAHGHRRVAYMDTYHDQSSDAYEAGIRTALESVGASLSPEMLCYGSTPNPEPAAHEDEVLSQLKALLQLPSPPTAILTAFVSFAELIYVTLRDLGLRVPEDISLLSFGGTWRESAVARRLTTVTVDEALTARMAARTLHEMCNDARPMDDNEEFDIPLSVYEGRTLAAPSTETSRTAN